MSTQSSSSKISNDSSDSQTLQPTSAEHGIGVSKPGVIQPNNPDATSNPSTSADAMPAGSQSAALPVPIPLTTNHDIVPSSPKIATSFTTDLSEHVQQLKLDAKVNRKVRLLSSRGRSAEDLLVLALIRLLTGALYALLFVRSSILRSPTRPSLPSTPPWSVPRPSKLRSFVSFDVSFVKDPWLHCQPVRCRFYRPGQLAARPALSPGTAKIFTMMKAKT